MRQKGSGGTRDGAGRPPALSFEQRVLLGTVIERRIQRKTRLQLRQKVRARYADDELEALWAQLRKIPVADRLKLRAQWKERHGDKPFDLSLDPGLIGRLINDVRAEIEEGGLQGQRFFSGPKKTPDGIRKQVLGDLARAATRLWKKPVSVRLAEKCLEEVRAITARPKPSRF
jgi:hypothetical protein